jgi:hypothetical protein
LNPCIQCIIPGAWWCKLEYVCSCFVQKFSLRLSLHMQVNILKRILLLPYTSHLCYQINNAACQKHTNNTWWGSWTSRNNLCGWVPQRYYHRGTHPPLGLPLALVLTSLDPLYFSRCGQRDSAAVKRLQLHQLLTQFDVATYAQQPKNQDDTHFTDYVM